jgi:hypothetical protein
VGHLTRSNCHREENRRLAAMLAVSAIGPELSPAPDRLLLALEQGGRVFIANVKPTTQIKPIAA